MAVLDLSYSIDPPTNTTSWWEVDPHRGVDYFLVYGILAFFFVSFFAIVLVDMKRKHRTGELGETWDNLCFLVILLISLPFLIFSKRNLKALGVWFTNLFRSSENKHNVSSNSNTVTLDRGFDSQAIINRLASSCPLEPEAKGKGKKPEVTVKVFSNPSIKEKPDTLTPGNNTSSPNTTRTIVVDPPPENALFIVGNNVVEAPLTGGRDACPARDAPPAREEPSGGGGGDLNPSTGPDTGSHGA